tara:strand:- start:296 stop:1105 length:810 start_codon:yes stop_codon:yes gene_type:complete
MLSKHSLAQTSEEIVVATVNGSEVQLKDILDLIEQLPAEYQNQPLTSYFDQMVDEAINTKLAAKAGEKSALSDDPKVIEAMRLAAQKVLAEKWLRTELAVSVTEDAIKKAYDAYVADTASREEVKASHILLADEKTAIGAIQKLKDGADFAELAREISTGPSGPNGGDLGYFGRGAMVPAFEQAAFGLEIATFTSSPVQSQFGWHVIKLFDKRIAKAPSQEEMSQQLIQNITKLSFARIIETLRADAEIEKISLSEIQAEWQERQESSE